MPRWKVRKSRRTGDWWVHSAGCYELGGMWCILFGGDCVNCRTFETAFAYADTMARMDKRRTFAPTGPIAPGPIWPR